MKIPRIERGDPLTANYFNSVSETVNRLQQESTALAEAEETRAATTNGGNNVTPDNVGLIDGTEQGVESVGDETPTDTSNTYTESSRTTSTVRVEDPENSEVFVNVDRIDTVTLSGEQGDSLRLVFNND